MAFKFCLIDFSLTGKFKSLLECRLQGRVGAVCVIWKSSQGHVGFVSQSHLEPKTLSSSVHLLIDAIPSKWLIHLLKLPVPLNFSGNTRGRVAVAVCSPSCTGLSLGVAITFGLNSDSRRNNTRRQMTRGVRTLDLFGYHYGIFYPGFHGTTDSRLQVRSHGHYGRLSHSRLSCRLCHCNNVVTCHQLVLVTNSAPRERPLCLCVCASIANLQ